MLINSARGNGSKRPGHRVDSNSRSRKVSRTPSRSPIDNGQSSSLPARQTGKTTLVRELLDLPGHAWFSFDDEAVLARAADDPVGFVDALPRPAAVDEFQRAGRGF
ncbi:hypothetical protein K7G98_36130, partial [Saccharothrix sp. MB29]|nr:hypothetical protein [Saccharothrix sp. MB29]